MTEIVICTHPCKNWDCEHHPVRMEGRGEEYPCKDLHGTEECRNGN